jgi:FkbM family methyltransferase
MSLTKILKNIFKLVGYDLVRLNGGLGYGTSENELLKILYDIDTDLILDVGANRGQFGASLYRYGYQQKTLSFEPLSAMHDLLLETSKKNTNWHVFDKCCVGAEEKETVINVSNLVGNSSVLGIKNTKFNVQNSHYVAQEQVPQITLATLNDNKLIKAAKNIFVKMDIQGYEHFVLTQLNNIDYKINGFYLELSLVKLYDDQEDYLYICKQLKTFGYDLVYIESESIRAGRMIQFNGVFLHNSISYSN